MSRPRLLLLAAVLASPVGAYLVYRAAKGLGFLDPPVSREHELRRAILAALYALLIFLPVFLFGWERRWPRVWILFGVVSGLALVFFAASGIVSARALWGLRHLPAIEPEAPGAAPEAAPPLAPAVPDSPRSRPADALDATATGQSRSQ